MAEKQIYYGTGRRKTSKARVFLRPGSGNVTINTRKEEEFLFTAASRVIIKQPFMITNTKGRFDAEITVVGGGTTGQAEAIRHGISRALTAADPAFRPALKKAGLLTRDSRMVERKKYGKHGARRSTQFSKR